MDAGVVLIFEADPETGMMILRPADGSAGFVPEADLRDIERELRRRYTRLIGERSDSLSIKSYVFDLEVGDSDNARQRPLVLRLRPRCLAPPPPAPVVRDARWTEGFFEELTRLTNLTAAEAGLSPLERRILGGAVEELQSLKDLPSLDLASLLFAGFLILADKKYRQSDGSLAESYRVALRGLERLMARAPGDDPARGEQSLLFGRPWENEREGQAKSFSWWFGWLPNLWRATDRNVP